MLIKLFVVGPISLVDHLSLVVLSITFSSLVDYHLPTYYCANKLKRFDKDYKREASIIYCQLLVWIGLLLRVSVRLQIISL